MPHLLFNIIKIARAFFNQLNIQIKKGQKAVKTEFLLGKTDRLYVLYKYTSQNFSHLISD